MSALANHIAAINAKTQAWIDAGENRWAGMITDDLEYWAEAGVYTPAQFDRYMLEATYSDLYKEVYGVRPRDFTDMSDADLSAALEGISKDAQEAFDADREYEAYAATLDAEEARMSSLTESAPFPYEEYDV